MTDLELDEILTLRWPAVVRRVMGDASAVGFTQDFVRSISHQGRRKAWQPTAKQARIMRQLLDQYTGLPEREPDLIERED